MTRNTMVVGVLLLALPVLVFGQKKDPGTDPANLFFGNGATGTQPIGATHNFCTDSNCGGAGELTANNGDLSMYFNSDGTNKGPLDNPVLLILAVPNDTAGGELTAQGAASIVSVNLYNPYGNSSNPGTAIPVTVGFGGFGLSGFGGLMTSSDVYTKLGTNGDASFNFANMSDADKLSPVNISSVTNYGLYVFSLQTSLYDVGDLFDIVLNTKGGAGTTGVPVGTFALGLGCNDSTATNILAYDKHTNANGCAGGNIFGTPFTEGGIETGTSGGGGGGGGGSVPEPTSIVLLGTIAVIIAGISRRKARFS